MLLLKKLTFWLALAGVFAAVNLVIRLRATVTEPIPAPTLQPARKPYPHSLGAAGLVEATHENTLVGTPLAGLVAAVEVRVWDRVKVGQVLFRLDDRDLQAALKPQLAQIAVAEAALERVRGQFARLEAVDDPRAIAAEEVRLRRADVAVAEAQLEAAKATVAQTRALLERLIVRSPIEGTVLQANTRVGEFVVPGSATPPFILGSIDELQVRVDLDEQLAPRVRSGAPAVGYIKGDASHPIPLQFVRIEPVIIPKRSLTGASIERVDTRVLQVIYRCPPQADQPIYVGQQMDIFVEEKP
ncbi:efflux RND transporter periplasmic adaptor subunit [Nibricoccus sp. IMCC34717]|uniref:efflux RND transporter periplasmic adaptor subunit n=1 Tax=Nibricoccus sp. IMCC34717 TaxID=3034021 RepID=UPI00384A7666